jgi:hypothetical protein
MKKIPTLFLRDPDDMRRLTRQVHPECGWVLDGEGIATRKYDGTCVSKGEDGRWLARREVKAGKNPPPNFLPVETDEATGKTVGWEPIEQSPFVKFFEEALRNTHSAISQRGYPAGTYELVGEKINGNPEHVDGHLLWSHTAAEVIEPAPRDYDGLVVFLRSVFEGEGIVWHHPDGRMAKIKRRDFSGKEEAA